MRIVHVQGVQEEKPVRPTKRQLEIERARERLARRVEADYRKALDTYKDEIAEIRKADPNWTIEKVGATGL